MMIYRWAVSAGHNEHTWEDTGGKGIIKPNGEVFEEFHFNKSVVEKLMKIVDYNNKYIFKYDMIDFVLLNKDLGDYRSTLREKINTEREMIPSADLVFSVHANANSNTSIKGSWTFYWGTSTKGKRLADIMQKYKRKWLPNKIYSMTGSQVDHWTNFGILRDTKAPAILEEFDFFTNPDGLELLESDIFQWQCARALFETGCEFCGVEEYTVELKPPISPWEPSFDGEPIDGDLHEIPIDSPQSNDSFWVSLVRLLLSLLKGDKGK